MDIKEVLRKLRGRLVKVCFFVPETSIDECVQGALHDVDDDTICIVQPGARVWLSHVVVYLVADLGHIDTGGGYG